MKRLYFYIIIVILVGLLFHQCNDRNAKLNDLRRVNDSLKVEYLKLVKTSDSILKIKNKLIIKYDTIEKIKYIIKYETDSIVDSVVDLSERELDSTIRAYKHIDRAKN